jgi:hypothetical protein
MPYKGTLYPLSYAGIVPLDAAQIARQLESIHMLASGPFEQAHEH